MLISSEGQAGAFGAKATLYGGDISERMGLMREARSAYGYLAQDDPVLHFGLGRQVRVDLEVHFLDRT